MPKEPDFRIQIVDGKTLFVKNDLLVNRGSNDWQTVGGLEEITLDEKTLETLFLIADDGWLDTSAEEILENNSKAWLVTEAEYAYLLLLQKDGTVYLGLGYTGEVSILRVLYHLTAAEDEIHSDPRFGSSGFYGVASYDIDKDGIDESLALGMGSTSGVFSFTITAYDKANGTVKYGRVFISEWYDLSLISENGVIKVQGITQDEPPETHVFDIEIKDGVLDLTENGVSITETTENTVHIPPADDKWNSGGSDSTKTNHIPAEIRERIIEVYFGDRASEVTCKNEADDSWQLGKGGDADYYTYHTVPTATGSLFILVNRYQDFNYLKSNELPDGFTPAISITEVEAMRLCSEFLNGADPSGTYQTTGTVNYGKESPSFYAIRYERVSSVPASGGFVSFLFYVNANGIGYIEGEYVSTPPVSFTAVIRKWSDEADGFLGMLELDLVEYITDRDTARIEELGLTEQDLPGGYYILNSEDKATMLKIPTGSEFVFYDWWDDFKEDPRCDSYEKRWVTTKDISLFIDYLETYNKATHGMVSHPRMPFIIEEINGAVRITEIFLM